MEVENRKKRTLEDVDNVVLEKECRGYIPDTCDGCGLLTAPSLHKYCCGNCNTKFILCNNCKSRQSTTKCPIAIGCNPESF